MNEVEERRKVLAIFALEHYIERLNGTEQDERIFLFSEQLKAGLLKERSVAQVIIEHIEKSGFGIEHELVTSIFEEHSPMRNTLTSALLCYHNDLVESLDIVYMRLHSDPDFPLLKEEIKFCKQFLMSHFRHTSNHLIYDKGIVIFPDFNSYYGIPKNI
jgi:hypothetical protein